MIFFLIALGFIAAGCLGKCFYKIGTLGRDTTEVQAARAQLSLIALSVGGIVLTQIPQASLAAFVLSMLLSSWKFDDQS